MATGAAGFALAWTAQNLACAVAGSLLGRAVSAGPRFSPLMLLALLLPVVRALDALPGLILLTSAVLGAQRLADPARLSATSGALPAAPDNARWVAFGAAGAGALLVSLLTLPLAEWGNRLGPAEWVALLTLVLVAALVLASASLLRGLAMLLLGLLLAQVGGDPTTGIVRYSFGWSVLEHGIPFLAVAIGLYAIGPAIGAACAPARALDLPPASPVPVAPLPREQAWRRRRITWRPAAAQAARRCGNRVALIPLFSFGLPFNASLALLFGAMVQKGLRPGPELAVTQPHVVWGLLASLWVGWAMLLVLDMPFLRRWAWHWSQWFCAGHHAVAAVVVLASVGLATAGGGSTVLWFCAGFAVLGTVFHRLGCPPTPLLLGFVLQPVLEANLRRALLLSDGDWATFVTRPLSSGLLVVAALVVALSLLPPMRKRRKRYLQPQ